MGKSGRSILRALATGQDSPELLADRAVGSLRNKISALIPVLEGRPDEHFRWMLGGLLDKLESLDQEVNSIGIELRQRLASDEDLLDRLATIPRKTLNQFNELIRRVFEGLEELKY